MVYRGGARPCPACAKKLVAADRFERCEGCDGIWIEAARLAELFAELKQPVPPFEPTTGPPRACAACREAMPSFMLGPIVVERCDSHGVWFDREELGTALREGNEPLAVKGWTAGDVWDFLKQMFATPVGSKRRGIVT